MGSTNSGPKYLPGQRPAVGEAVFGAGGIFDQFISGKPNAAFDRAQRASLQQIMDMQSQSGVAGTPLATRQRSDFLAKSNQMAGDNFMQQLGMFMQPAGTGSKSAGFWGGKG